MTTELRKLTMTTINADIEAIVQGSIFMVNQPVGVHCKTQPFYVALGKAKFKDFDAVYNEGCFVVPAKINGKDSEVYLQKTCRIIFLEPA